MHCPTFSLIPKVFIFSDSNRTDGPEEINRPPETYFIKTGRFVIVHELCDLCSKNDIIVMIVTAWTFQILLPINLQNHVMITDIITDFFPIEYIVWYNFNGLVLRNIVSKKSF